MVCFLTAIGSVSPHLSIDWNRSMIARLSANGFQSFMVGSTTWIAAGELLLHSGDRFRRGDCDPASWCTRVHRENSWFCWSCSIHRLRQEAMPDFFRKRRLPTNSTGIGETQCAIPSCCWGSNFADCPQQKSSDSSTFRGWFWT